MLSTLDMLYIILAICAIWLVFFISWFILSIIRVSKAVIQTLDEVREQLRHVEHAIHGVRVKFEDGAGHMKTMSGVIKKFAMGFAEKKMKDFMSKEKE